MYKCGIAICREDQVKFLCLQVMESFVRERYSTSPGDDVMFLRSLLLSWLQIQVHVHACLFLSTVATAKSVMLMTLGLGLWHGLLVCPPPPTHTHTYMHTQLMKVMVHVSSYTCSVKFW